MPWDYMSRSFITTCHQYQYKVYSKCVCACLSVCLSVCVWLKEVRC